MSQSMTWADGAGRAEICSDSEMWQSPAWSEAVDTVWRRKPLRRWENHGVLVAARLVARRLFAKPSYRAVLTTGNRATLYYGLLCRLLFIDQQQVVAQLYLDQHPGVLGLLHDRLMRWVLRGTYGVIVSSRDEMSAVESRYRVSRSRMRYVPYHTTLIEPQNLGTARGYVFAGGRNYRDYETLVEAVADLDVPTVIVCGERQLRGVALPSNVTVHREIPWERYLALLRGASFVVVPLSSGYVPSGQVAILEAMGYGKPVITTRAVGTVDYVRDGVDGLLYELGDAVGLARQIERLSSDAEWRELLGAAAFEAVVEQFTFERHVVAKLAAIRELAGLASSGPTNRDDAVTIR
jgi:glycosyltransferase involved in cell wall biosynthesis